MIPCSAAVDRVIPSKPRASGDDPGGVERVPQQLGVNPARAGMILVGTEEGAWPGRKPRASGDDPRAAIPLIPLQT